MEVRGLRLLQQAVVEADHVRELSSWRCARRCRAGARSSVEADGHEAVAVVGDAVEVARVGAASIRPGATMAVGEDLAHRALDQLERPSRSASDDRRDGFEAHAQRLTSMRSSAMARLTKACTCRSCRRAGCGSSPPPRPAGQHVFLVAGVEHGQRRGGAQHGVGGLRPWPACCSTSGPSATGWTAPPLKPNSSPAPRRRTSRPPRRWMPPASVPVQSAQRRAEHADGAAALGRRHRRMAGRGLRRELERHRALLGQPDQRHRLARPGSMPSVTARPSSMTKSSRRRAA
jgi:hypothetical protein